MRTLVHLSDLHFGRIDPELLDPLRRCVQGLKPHLLVVSGDLTQRARKAQFAEAKRYLDTLPKPQIIVPGNHDVPLYNLFKRFLQPLKNFRSIIADDLEPAYIDEEMAVVGINTARSFTFKDGRVSDEQIERVRERLCRLDDRINKIIVTHHPFDLPEDWDDDEIVGRAPVAMQMFSRFGADMLLAGHLHISHTGHTAARYKIAGYSALVVQAGTATSTRGRGEANSFNAIRIDGDDVDIDRYSWDEGHKEFIVAGSEAFTYAPDGWKAKGGRNGTSPAGAT